jgi:hypothetical protein
MARFKYDPKTYSVLESGIHIAQVIAGKNGITKGNDNDPEQYPMMMLTVSTVPVKRRLFYHLIFGGRGFFTVRDFCASAELELPEEEEGPEELSLPIEDCLNRIVYALVRQEEDNGGILRARVKRLLSRDQALNRNPDLEVIPLPPDVPAPKRVAMVPASPINIVAEPPAESATGASNDHDGQGEFPL